MSVTLYPELIDYIYQYCDHFKTADEKLAGRTMLYKRKTDNAQTLAMMKAKGWYSDEQHILNMFADGNQAFIVKVASRIYIEHKDELNLNLCPRCFKITRTPWAKQCRFCFHDWH